LYATYSNSIASIFQNSLKRKKYFWKHPIILGVVAFKMPFLHVLLQRALLHFYEIPKI